MKLETSKKVSDLIHPSPYQFWFRYVKGTDLETRIGPARFAEYMHEQNAIQLFHYFKEGDLKCKNINHSHVTRLLNELAHLPCLQSLPWGKRLVRLIRQTL